MKTLVIALGVIALAGGGFAAGRVIASGPTSPDHERIDHRSLTMEMDRIVDDSGRNDTQIGALRLYAHAYAESILSAGSADETRANTTLMQAEACLAGLMSFAQVSEQRTKLDAVVRRTSRGRALFERHLRSISSMPGISPEDRRCN